jgi:hypothetical protein
MPSYSFVAIIRPIPRIQKQENIRFIGKPEIFVPRFFNVPL